MGFQLDALDYKILKMLSENARRPYLEIARECGVSGAAVCKRTDRMPLKGNAFTDLYFAILLSIAILFHWNESGYSWCATIFTVRCSLRNVNRQ